MATPVRTAIRLAMRARMATIPSLPPVAYEFEPFTPQAGVVYLREKLLMAPQSAEVVSTGPNPIHRVRAIYQLAVCVPLVLANATMPGRAGDFWADTLCQQFSAGLAVTYDGRRVVIQQASSATQQPMPPDWTQIPVSIACWCDVTSFTA